MSLLAVLMLRGAQTPGELRQRTERMHRFGEEELEATLAALEERELVRLLPRRPGQREQRYEQLLGGVVGAPPAPSPRRRPVSGRRAAAGSPTASRHGWSGSSPSSPRCARSSAPCARSWARERARGPGSWPAGPGTPIRCGSRWLEHAYEPPADLDRQADTAVDALRERGSPCHDGLSTRLASFAEVDGGLALELQPSRWALRLVDADASESLTALCVVRTEDGRWLAGRRAGWVSTWAGRWALGAGGAVDLGESPAETLPRELREEWQLEAHSLSIEALVRHPQRAGDGRRAGHGGRHLGARGRTTSTTNGRGGIPIRTAGPTHADDRVRMMGRLLAAAR